MEVIQQIKNNITLSQYLQKYVMLKNKGQYHWGCCPFHQEKTPSFMVDDVKNIFHCFGCGKHGDIYIFLQDHLKISFFSSLELLAQEQNIKLIKKPAIHHRAKVILKIINEYYHKTNKEKVINYLKNRSINLDNYEKFQLGYSDNSIIRYLLDENYTKEEIAQTGIKIFGMNDRFRNRLIIPILNRQKEVIGFSGRVLDNSLPKYLNSPETPIFHKGLHLFNEHQMKYKPIILVEGYLDVISLQDHGFNSAAIMGTSLTIEQIITAWKFTNIIYLAFDGDSAGRRAISRSIPIILKTLNPKRQVFICEVNEDPDHMLKTEGISAIDSMLKNSLNVHKYIEQHLLSPKDSPTQYAQRLLEIDQYVDQIKNKYIKEAYQLFWKKSNSLYKYRHSKGIIPKIINKEDQLFTILLNYPEQLFIHLEQLMNRKFNNDLYQKIHKIMIRGAINNLNTQEILETIKIAFPKQYNKLTQNSTFLCNINIVILKWYLPDLINAIKRL